MKKLPTVEEQFEKFFDSFPRNGTYLAESWKKEIQRLAKNFAKQHVLSALEAASENVKQFDEKHDYQGVRAGGSYYVKRVDKQSILKSYPLTNIK